MPLGEGTNGPPQGSGSLVNTIDPFPWKTKEWLRAPNSVNCIENATPRATGG